MKSLVALASALFVTMAASEAGAVSLWKYRYEGPQLVNQIPGDLAPLSGYQFEFVVDERLIPSRTLVSSQVLFNFRGFSRWFRFAEMLRMAAS